MSDKKIHRILIKSSILIFFAIVPSLCGCSFLLPSEKMITKNPWKTFEDVKIAFDKIVPGETKLEDIKRLGFDPEETPNIEIWNYLDVIGHFMPNSSIRKRDLDKGLRDCITAKDDCHALNLMVKKINKKRYGNVFLDLLRFARKTRTSGWQFDALIIMKNDFVVYKIWSGKPNINESIEKKMPLGPLQEAGNLLDLLSF